MWNRSTWVVLKKTGDPGLGFIEGTMITVIKATLLVVARTHVAVMKPFKGHL